MSAWPSGVYEGPPLLRTRLVVVSELPVSRSTLLLRLLGAGHVLRQAIAELKALGPDAEERTLALPILLRLRLDVPADPTKRTTDDQEFLMETQDIVENWRREAKQEGRHEAASSMLLRLLQQRFGSEVNEHVEQLVTAAPLEQLERWTMRVLTAATLTELLAQ